jgi:16S rRNA (adenine1518-N6/adenine1519-N6)-dimethyltransferase
VGRRLGQHFLKNQSTLARIAQAVSPEPEPLVVEIGPGRGALTQHLIPRAGRVIALEVDPVLIPYLRHKFRETPNLSVIEGDVLTTDLGQWGPAVIAGNLPYYITSPILTRVFSLGGLWRRCVFLVQKEVAERLTASPGLRDYGYLTVHTNVHASPEYLFAVSRGAFSPPPKVDSAVIRLSPRDAKADFGIADVPAFLDFASLCFRQKRKTLRNNLAPRFGRDTLAAVPAKARAEELSIPELHAIFSALSHALTGPSAGS